MESNVRANKVLVLCDIRSNENVGSLFRTADAIGIEQIILAGITPTPIDRFGRAVGAIAKTALGAEKTIPWEKTLSLVEVLVKLKKGGYQIIAIEQAKNSTDYRNVPIAFPVVFVLGNEVEGLSEEILSLVDIVAEIPMNGTKESLNVAVAGGVALFRMLSW